MCKKILLVKLFISGQLLSDKNFLLPEPGTHFPPPDVMEDARHLVTFPPLVEVNQ